MTEHPGSSPNRRTAGLFAVIALAAALQAGCMIETIIFPISETPELLPEPPAGLGPAGFNQRRAEFDDLGDGQPGGVTIFEPAAATDPSPLLVWVLGVNNRAHFHQSLHEFLASWGYAVVIPDTRDISFFDARYHRRNVDNALATYSRAVGGDLALLVDPQRTAFGGYSVGGSLAAFAAAEQPQARGLVMWAPAPAPAWQGLNPAALLPWVRQPSLFLLAEFDIVTPADQWPAELMRQMSMSSQTVFTVAQGVHLYFQQPGFVDERNPPTMMTRIEQMRIGLEQTRAFLDDALDLPE